MKKILVSQCLYGGEPVRYDGKSKSLDDERFLQWKAEGRLIPICPEVFGGLPIPRVDAQRQDNRIVTRDGRDVTDAYQAGAEEAVRLAQENQVVCALLKEKSPSCGSNRIYDGTFSGKLVEGRGLTAELLGDAGIPVFSEEQLEQVERLLKNNVVLIGMPACGKSVTGVLLAKILRMKFIDADLLIQEETGRSLQAIIDEDGIEAFKEIEKKILLSIDDEHAVIATGGSAVYYPEAMEQLKKDGVIVHIETSLPVIKSRLQNIKTRGVAMKKGQTLDELYDARVPLYRRYEDVRVSSERGSMEDTVADIATALKPFGFL